MLQFPSELTSELLEIGNHRLAALLARLQLPEGRSTLADCWIWHPLAPNGSLH